jgi:hypothetical protein
MQHIRGVGVVQLLGLDDDELTTNCGEFTFHALG